LPTTIRWHPTPTISGSLSTRRAPSSNAADEQAVVDALEAGVLAGLLVEPEPGAERFAHELTRDALYADVPGVLRARWHARVADALQVLHPEDVTALAHHLYQSGTAAGARAAVSASTAARRR
jgi:hypothetical protein